MSSACLRKSEASLGPLQKQQVLHHWASLQLPFGFGARQTSLHAAYLAEDDLEILNLLLPPLEGVCHRAKLMVAGALRARKVIY